MSNFPSDKPVLVTCGLPYANGKCHIGHLRTYVPGDIFVRSLRKQGQEAAFICGSDAHGTPNDATIRKMPYEVSVLLSIHLDGYFFENCTIIKEVTK